VKRGEVWWAEEPADSPRPYLVLTRDQAIPSLNKLIVAPATRTIRNIPTEVELSREDGMGVECVLNLDNTTLILKALLIEHMTTLRGERMSEVCRALARATNC
jgi:mRNA interferase MazF